MSTPERAATRAACNAAQFIADGHWESKENPAGYWLLLFSHIASFCEVSIGHEASRQVIRQFAAECGSGVH